MSDGHSQQIAQRQRIVHLIPGTGHYLCGSCLRDHALAQALHRRGHDVSILPLYLPLSLEQESNIPTGAIFLGGINLDFRHRFRWYARLPRFLTAWLDAPGLLRLVSHRTEMTQARHLGEMTVETLRGEYGSLRTEIERLGRFLQTPDQPDVIHLSNAMLISLAAPLKRLTGARIVCTLQGEIPFLDSLPEPFRTHAWEHLVGTAKHVDQFVAVSEWYGLEMQDRLAIKHDRWHCIHNGIDVAPFVQASSLSRSAPPTIGYLARLCEDKGLATLSEAFFDLVKRPGMERVGLRAAGVMLERDKALVERLKRRAESLGLTDRFTIEPSISLYEKVGLLHSLTVLSVPATCGESFGLYILEAHACGVPVVQPRHGAFPEILRCSGGGLLCEPNDPKSLADALERVVGNPDLREGLSQQARASIDEHFTSDIMARRFEQTCMMMPTDSATSVGAACLSPISAPSVESDNALRVPSQTSH